MKKRSIQTMAIFMFSLLLALLPVMALAAAEQAKPTPPPISQPLFTEAELAVDLVSALDVSSTTDEVAAESALGDIGIAPRNGWIADYPVTPDIVGELQQSVAAAADAGKLSISRDDALKRFGDVVAGFDLTVRAYASGESALDKPLSCDTYPNPAMIYSTYSGEGPPIVTYYCPPPDYYDLYAWVPYPFWWSDFWFPGFFILRDFDRHHHHHHHHHNNYVHFTNHFNDVKRHHVFRIDPVDRFHGRTFSGIGVKTSRDFISTGVPRSSHTIFNPPRGGNAPAGRDGMGPSMRSGPSATPSHGGSSGGGMRGGSSSGGSSSGGMHGGGSSGTGRK
jgi:uncharacterized membrane protein YgcG